MLKYKFSFKEIILVIIAAVLALGIFYYQVILKSYNNAKTTYDTSILQDEQSVLLAKAQKLKTMQDYIDSHSSTNYGTIAVYNNQANEISALSRVFEGKIDNVSINWSEPVLTDTIVRRNATISFKTNNYDLAKELVEDIINLRYRCIITNMSIADSNQDSLSDSNSINVSLNVTFYETIEGASDTSGLVIEEE